MLVIILSSCWFLSICVGIMAEVDEIIIYGLKSIGLDLEDAQSLSEFDGAMFFKACASCIKLIQPGVADSTPSTLPTNTATRFKACTALSQVCACHPRGFAQLHPLFEQIVSAVHQGPRTGQGR